MTWGRAASNSGGWTCEGGNPTKNKPTFNGVGLASPDPLARYSKAKSVSRGHREMLRLSSALHPCATHPKAMSAMAMPRRFRVLRFVEVKAARWRPIRHSSDSWEHPWMSSARRRPPAERRDSSPATGQRFMIEV